MSRNRPYARQDGFITIIKEAGWHERYKIERTENGFQWRLPNNTTIPAEIVWTDVFVSSVEWGKKPKTVKHSVTGMVGEREETIGFEPSLSFRSAFINKNIFNLMKFRTKYRIIIEYKNSQYSPVEDEFEFKGASFNDYRISGDGLIEESITISVEELPLNNE